MSADPVNRYVTALADELADMLPENPAYARLVIKNLQQRTGRPSPYAVVFASAAVLLACVGIFTLAQSTQSSAAPPLELRAVHLEADRLRLGDFLRIHLEARRNRACPSDIETVITEARTGKVVSSARQYGARQSVTAEFEARTVVKPLPEKITPGDFKLSRTVFNHCGGTTHATIVAADLPFTVVADR